MKLGASTVPPPVPGLVLPRKGFDPVSLALLARYPDVPIVDTSTRTTWKSCRRKSFLTSPAPFGMGLREHQAALPLEFGTLFHMALDSVYSTLPHDYAGAAQVFRVYALNRLNQLQHSGMWQSEIDAFGAQIDLGAAMLEEWSAWVPERDDFTVVETERPILVPVRRPSKPGSQRRGRVIALYYIRLDGLVRDRLGRYWVREYKTAGRWWDDRQKTLAEQVTAYAWAVQEHYGYRVHGILMDFFLKQAVVDPPLLKSGWPTTAISRLTYTTAERYERVAGEHPLAAEVDDVLLALQDREKAVGHPTLRRELIERTPASVQLQGHRIAKEVVKMLQSVGDTDPTVEPGHCGYCSVFELCAIMEDGGAWRPTADALYDKSTPMWDQDREASN